MTYHSPEVRRRKTELYCLMWSLSLGALLYVQPEMWMQLDPRLQDMHHWYEGTKFTYVWTLCMTVCFYV